MSYFELGRVGPGGREYGMAKKGADKSKPRQEEKSSAPAREPKKQTIERASRESLAVSKWQLAVAGGSFLLLLWVATRKR